jgi:hypothetical protein
VVAWRGLRSSRAGSVKQFSTSLGRLARARLLPAPGAALRRQRAAGPARAPHTASVNGRFRASPDLGVHCAQACKPAAASERAIPGVTARLQLQPRADDAALTGQDEGALGRMPCRGEWLHHHSVHGEWLEHRYIY